MSEKMYREYQLKILGTAVGLLVLVVSFFLVRTFSTIDNTSDQLNKLTTSFEVFKIEQKTKNDKVDAMDVTLQKTKEKVDEIKTEQKTKLDKILNNQ